VRQRLTPPETRKVATKVNGAFGPTATFLAGAVFSGFAALMMAIRMKAQKRSHQLMVRAGRSRCHLDAPDDEPCLPDA